MLHVLVSMINEKLEGGPMEIERHNMQESNDKKKVKTNAVTVHMHILKPN